MKRLLAAALACALLLQPVPALAQARVDAPAAMAMQDVELRAFIQDVARATGLTFIVDPSVQGTVSINREQPMDDPDLLGLLLAVLRGNGLIAVPAGPRTYRVAPAETAARQPRGAGGGDFAFATEVFPLRSVDARAAAETIKPLVGLGGVVAATPGSNSLLVADYADNLRRIRALVAQIDNPNASIDTVTLRNSAARDIAATVNALFAPPGAEGARNAALSILPVESSNSIVVRGDATQVQRVVQMALELDSRAERTGNVRVVPLRHASAEQLLPVLQQLVGQAAAGDDREQVAGGGAIAIGPDGASEGAAQLIAPAPGRRPVIVRAPGQNALVISADPDTQRTLVEVIEQLDVRRRQVLVEAIVVEISDDAARKLSAQLATAGRDGNVPFTATQYPGADPGILSLAAAAALDPDSDAGAAARKAAMQSLLGLSGGLAGVAGSAGDTLFGLIINAVKSDTASNLLSTPSILTLDNEAARILVGQEVPITTGEVLGNDNSNPFRTIQREDVGIQLEVTPQINAGGGITLKLRQEVSSVAGPVSADFGELVLNKREIETNVLVDNGAIVALGGLLDQSERDTVHKVPLLGDIPVVGALFRSSARANARTNLMVFIRPTVIENAEDARRATAPRYDYMRQAQLGFGNDDAGRREAALDVLVRDYLRAQPPTLPPAPPPTAPGAVQ